MIQVLVIANPFQPLKDLRRSFGLPGQTVRQWLHEAFGPEFVDFEQPTICQYNGAYLLRTSWGTTELKEGDVLAFATVPRGIELIVLAIVAVVVAVAVVTLMPDPKIPNDASSSPDPAYTLRGQTNRFRPGEPIEVPYGKVRHWPTYITRPYSEYDGNQQYQYSLYCVGQGRFEFHDKRLEDTPIEDFEEVQINVVQPGGDLELIHSNVVTAAEVNNIELFGPNEEDYDGWSGPFTLNEFDSPIKKIGVDIGFPQGLYKMDKKGKLTAYSVDLEFQYREINAGGSPIGTWEDLVTITVTRSDNTPQRLTRRTTVPSGRYEVRGRRTSDKEDDIKIGSQAKWEAVKGYERLNNDFGEVTLIEMISLATNNLNDQTARAFNVKITRKLRMWDPVDGWSALTATRNPAWAFLDIYRAQYGAKLETQFLDLQTFYDLSLVYETKNQNFDWIFDQPTTIWDAGKMVLRVGRTYPIPQGSLITAVRDKAQTFPSAMFTQDNIVTGSLTEKLSMFEFNPVSGVIIEYTDNDTWKPREVTCILDGMDDSNLERIKFPGCTNRNKAYQEGLYIMSRRTYQRTVVTFQTGLEGHIPSYLDLISIAHDTIRVGQGGMILAYDTATNTMTLSEEVNFATDNVVHVIAIRQDDGSIQGNPIVCTRGNSPNKVVLATDPSPALDLSSDRVPPLYAFGLETSWSFLGKVVAIKPMDEKTVEITCVNYTTMSYDFDEAETIDVTPVKVIRNKSNPVVASLSITAVPDHGDRIFIDWPPVRGAVSYRLQTSYDDGITWNPVGNFASPPVQLTVNPGPVKARIAPFALNGNVIYTESNEFVTGSNIPVPTSVLFGEQPAFEGLTLTVVWNAVTSAEGYIAEIYLADGTTLLREIEAGTATTLNYTHADFIADHIAGSNRSFVVKVLAYNEGGENTPSTIVRANPVPTVPGTLAVGAPTGTDYPVTWVQADTDLLAFYVHSSTTMGFTPGPGTLKATRMTQDAVLAAPVRPLYWRVIAVDQWGTETAVSAEAVIP